MARGLAISWEEVEEAAYFRFGEPRAVLDLQTGHVRWHRRGEQKIGEADLTAAELQAHPERYIRIDPPPWYLVFDWMEHFTEGISGSAAYEISAAALKTREPFRAFKEALAEQADLTDQWNAFELAKRRAYIASWATKLPVKVLNPPTWLTELWRASVR